MSWKSYHQSNSVNSDILNDLWIKRRFFKPTHRPGGGPLQFQGSIFPRHHRCDYPIFRAMNFSKLPSPWLMAPCSLTLYSTWAKWRTFLWARFHGFGLSQELVQAPTTSPPSFLPCEVVIDLLSVCGFSPRLWYQTIEEEKRAWKLFYRSWVYWKK